MTNPQHPGDEFLAQSVERFHFIKSLSERAAAQLNDEQLHARPDEDANSVAIVMGHIIGNLNSRWTDFLNSDGEKSWRQRDAEFEPPQGDRATLMQAWEDAWKKLFDALEPLSGDDVLKTVTIRSEPHSVIQAIQRQLSHYSYHAGQIVTLARQHVGSDWQSLSIPRGKSNDFNKSMGHKTN